MPFQTFLFLLHNGNDHTELSSYVIIPSTHAVAILIKQYLALLLLLFSYSYLL